jgi:predicted amidohydrolase
MSYSNPVFLPLAFGQHDFGAGGEAFTFRGPSGKQGTLIDIEINATEVFSATSAEGKIELGSSASGAQYAAFGLGTTADGATARASDTSGDIVSSALPADTDIHVTYTAPTGGTPTGIAYVEVMVEWY